MKSRFNGDVWLRTKLCLIILRGYGICELFVRRAGRIFLFAFSPIMQAVLSGRERRWLTPVIPNIRSSVVCR